MYSGNACFSEIVRLFALDDIYWNVVRVEILIESITRVFISLFCSINYVCLSFSFYSISCETVT